MTWAGSRSRWHCISTDPGRRLSNLLLSLGCAHGLDVHGGLVHYFSLAIEMRYVSCRSTRRPRRNLANTSTRGGGRVSAVAPLFARVTHHRDPVPALWTGILMYLRSHCVANSMVCLQVMHISLVSLKRTTLAAMRSADKRGGIIHIIPRQISYPPSTPYASSAANGRYIISGVCTFGSACANPPILLIFFPIYFFLWYEFLWFRLQDLMRQSMVAAELKKVVYFKWFPQSAFLCYVWYWVYIHIRSIKNMYFLWYAAARRKLVWRFVYCRFGKRTCKVRLITLKRVHIFCFFFANEARITGASRGARSGVRDERRAFFVNEACPRLRPRHQVYVHDIHTKAYI